MNSSYANIDRLNYVASIDPIYAYQRCYKHVAMGVANDCFIYRGYDVPLEDLFTRCVDSFHARIQQRLHAPAGTHDESQAYRKAKKLIFERMAKLFRDEDTPYAKDMVFKAELILATHFSGKKRNKKGDEQAP